MAFEVILSKRYLWTAEVNKCTHKHVHVHTKLHSTRPYKQHMYTRNSTCTHKPTHVHRNQCMYIFLKTHMYTEHRQAKRLSSLLNKELTRTDAGQPASKWVASFKLGWNRYVAALLTFDSLRDPLNSALTFLAAVCWSYIIVDRITTGNWDTNKALPSTKPYHQQTVSQHHSDREAPSIQAGESVVGKKSSLAAKIISDLLHVHWDARR